MKTLFALLMFAAFAATAAIPLPELNWVPGSDWLNVKSFGAKGDGTTDDTAALQKAFDAVQDGTVIYCPPGVYPVSSELVIIKKPPFKGKEKRGNTDHKRGNEGKLSRIKRIQRYGQ